MAKLINRLMWFCMGVVFTHIGYYIYQIRYAKMVTGRPLPKAVAVVSKDVVGLIVSGFHKTLPLLIAHKEIVFALLALIILFVILLVVIRVAVKIRTNHTYSKKIKEAEEILARAEAKAAEKLKENQRLKQRLINDFEKKREAFQQAYNAKLQQYKDRIKKLERDQVELKENEATLMSHLRNR